MRILQVSNIVSHHQLPLARELSRLVGENNFRFCSTQATDDERVRLGWNCHDDEPWILRAGERESDRIQFEEWWDSADVVLCSERLFDKMENRLVQGKLCFYMSERWWKPPLNVARLLHPRFFALAMKFRKISRSQYFHYLPVGPYAESDISVLVDLEERMWRWGYFTNVPFFESKRIFSQSFQVRILWAGRMLNWKKVKTIILALSELTRNNIDFHLTLIGDGPERNKLERLAANFLNSKNYIFRGPVLAAQVPEIMSKTDIYVLPSSAYEGWGAVVNEAMSCGCAVVASREAGAAAAMIKDEINGLLFNSGDYSKLAELLIRLVCSVELRQRLSKEAQCTIEEVWAPSVVAERFYNVAEALLSNKDVPFYGFGPMSRSNF